MLRSALSQSATIYATLRAIAAVRQSVRNAGARVVVQVAAAAVIAAGCAFLTAAGFLALADEVGTINAAAIVGGSLVVVGVVALLVAHRRRRQQPLPMPHFEAALAEDARRFGLQAGARVGETLANNAVPMTIIALIIGMVAGASRRRPHGHRR